MGKDLKLKLFISTLHEWKEYEKISKDLTNISIEYLLQYNKFISLWNLIVWADLAKEYLKFRDKHIL